MEQASDEGFACTSCTPYVPKPVGKSQNLLKSEFERLFGKVCSFKDMHWMLSVLIFLMLSLPAFYLHSQ